MLDRMSAYKHGFSHSCSCYYYGDSRTSLMEVTAPVFGFPWWWKPSSCAAGAIDAGYCRCCLVFHQMKEAAMQSATLLNALHSHESVVIQ